MPKSSDFIIAAIALTALLFIILAWPRCGQRQRDSISGNESSLAAAASQTPNGAQVACMNCLSDYDNRLSATLLDRLTMSAGDLVARKAFPGRVGLNKWRRNQEKQDFWRWLNKKCPTGVIDYPGIVIKAEPLPQQMFTKPRCQSCGPL